jgi:hypothetical protein
MGNSISGISSLQLRRGVRVKEKIEDLHRELGKLLGGDGVGNGVASTPRKMSAEGKAKIATAQHKRWEAWRKSKGK